jgi:hypothetical protein
MTLIPGMKWGKSLILCYKLLHGGYSGSLWRQDIASGVNQKRCLTLVVVYRQTVAPKPFFLDDRCQGRKT